MTIVKNSIAKGASDEELKFCLTVARRYKLDPFKQQIWFVKRWDKSADNGRGGTGAHVWTPQVGINGLLFAAGRDHKAEFGSVSLPEYGPMLTIGSLKAPEWAKVKVFKKGTAEPTEAIAYWEEYCPAKLEDAPFWRRMPRRMIGKCATALAIRQAYPDLGGLYIPEEMERIAEDFTPSGRQIVSGPAPSGSREAAQAVAQAKIAAHAEGKPIDAEIVRETEPVSDQPKEYKGTVEIDWTPEESSPIVRGDIAELDPLLKKHCTMKWEGDWWHCLPKDVETIRQMCDQLGFKVKEIAPKVTPPSSGQQKKGAGESATESSAQAVGTPKAGVSGDARRSTKGASNPPPAPVLVSGTIQHFTEKMTKGGPRRASTPYLNVLIKTETGDRWYSVFDRDLFEFISKGKGKQGEFFVTQNGEYWNLVGLKRIGGMEFEEGKLPVTSVHREHGGSLFK